MRYSREVLQQIRDRTDILDLIGAYTKLERRGDRWWGLSPFKSEKTPSFTVQPDKGFYYCFATQQGGDIFRFVSEMEGLPFTESVEWLAERAGIEIGGDRRDDPREREARALSELYDRVGTTFAYLLANSPQGENARSYLRERTVSEESIERFGLGYAPEDAGWLHRFLRAKSYSDEFLSRSGLFSRNYPRVALFRNRVLFPIRDERGQIRAFGGRALETTDRAKYINSPDTAIYNKKRALYGLDLAIAAIRTSRQAVIAEGYFDVIALHESGVTNAVAPLGTAFTEEQARLLKRWADTVVLLFDADSAGVEASFKAAAMLESLGFGVFVATVQGGKDASDVYAESGATAVREIVDRAEPAFDFLVAAAAKATDPGRAENRELILRKVLPYINVVNSEVRRETMLQRLSEELNVSLAAVQADFDRWRGGGDKPNTADTSARRTLQTQSNREMTLMLASAREDELFAYLRSVMRLEELEDEYARYLYVALEDAYRHGERLPQGLVDRIDDESVRAIVLDRIGSDEFSSWTKQDIERAALNIRIRSVRREQKSIDIRLRKEQDHRATTELLERKMALDRELADLKVRVDDRVAE